jgi:hypothetical protein
MAGQPVCELSLHFSNSFFGDFHSLRSSSSMTWLTDHTRWFFLTEGDRVPWVQYPGSSGQHISQLFHYSSHHRFFRVKRPWQTHCGRCFHKLRACSTDPAANLQPMFSPTSTIASRRALIALDFTRSFWVQRQDASRFVLRTRDFSHFLVGRSGKSFRSTPLSFYTQTGLIVGVDQGCCTKHACYSCGGSLLGG